jgi:hypothetical protein
MPDDAHGHPTADPLDVVLLQGPTDDGEGAQVIRARGDQLEAGEVRPLRDGKPLSSGEIVQLVPRRESPCLFDVRVQHTLPATPREEPRPQGGPAQVATTAYRESWERTFGPRRRPELN